jgi:hypothetical protein
MPEVGDQEFQRVRKFKYIEFSITDDNITIEIKQKIVIANRASYGLKKYLSS